MMEKLAQANESGECTPTHFHFIYHHVQSCGVCYIAERAETLPYFYSTPICTLYNILWFSYILSLAFYACLGLQAYVLDSLERCTLGITIMCPLTRQNLFCLGKKMILFVCF
jgi:hypothetical protein